ncbi:hypothetical protein [Cohnella cellulosilytica]|uniref:Uridine kinase n=1 Tax=Cohnella cellulosilytica TaxID=986710 RepID=A0ABW2FP86_9BACL
MKNPKPFVVALAAVSGGGKTTITKKLAETLNNSEALYFDNYEFTNQPDDICEWVEKGANPNEWDLTPLINDLKRLLTVPAKPLSYIFVDYPFAYAHFGMNDLINFTVFVDTPLDIAMARRILRDFAQASIEEVKAELIHYLIRSRNAYINALSTIKPNSDFTIDGSSSVEAIVDMIVEEIKKRAN